MGEPRPEEDMVTALREAMERSAVITGSMVAKLDSMGNSASVIDAEIRPLQVRLPFRAPRSRPRSPLAWREMQVA
jgi:hypothetical protein